VAVIVNVEVPFAVGIPLMAPVVGCNVRPEGRLPVVTAKVNGACPADDVNLAP